jgi:benzoylsuccinyl-CoA thiolase BbsB subunit
MRSAYIAGVGQVPFGKIPERSLEEMGQCALLAAIEDAGVTSEDIDEAFCANVYGGMLTGQRILRDLGMTGIAVANVENACSSGSSALREGTWAIASGRADVVLVLGVEKLSGLGGGTIPLETTDVEVSQGQVMPAVYAMRARRYMHETGATVADLAQIAVKARYNGSLNPVAQFRQPVTIDDVLQSRMVADPLRLFMCCPTGDGAAAVILTTKEVARDLGSLPIRVAGTALQSGYFKTGFRDMASAELTTRTSRLAYEQAEIDARDVDLCELHDAFAIAELMYYEALGLCPSGQGSSLLRSGETGIRGRIPVNPSGGLLARGHPLGATGVAQAVEAVTQMRRQAGERQVEKDVRVAITHCTGGGISGLDHGACAVAVLVNDA